MSRSSALAGHSDYPGAGQAVGARRGPDLALLVGRVLLVAIFPISGYYK
jgi:hypothetical protein